MPDKFGKVEVIPSHGDDLTRRVSEALQNCGALEGVGADTRLAVKPNFTYPFYKAGVTTSPRVLRAVAGALREYTPHITIVESDGASRAWTAEQAFAGHEVPAICAELGIKSTGLTALERRKATASVAGREVEMELPRMLLDETDFLVTVPVPKVHANTGVSLGFKNQWGCIPDIKRVKHHADLPHKVLAVNKLIRAKVAVFDGTNFLNRSGPMDGDPVAMDLVIAGPTGAATRVCCEIMQIDPRGVAHLKLAMRDGLMPSDMASVEVNVDIARIARKFDLKRTPLDWVSYAIFQSAVVSRICYDSAASKFLHDVLYALKGRPKDFHPEW